MLVSVGAVIGGAVGAPPAIAADEPRSMAFAVQESPEQWCWKLCHEYGESLKIAAEHCLVQSLQDKANATRNFGLYQVLSECSSLSSLVVVASIRKSPLLKLHVESCATACKFAGELLEKSPGKEGRHFADQLGEISEACTNFAKTLKA